MTRAAHIVAHNSALFASEPTVKGTLTLSKALSDAANVVARMQAAVASGDVAAFYDSHGNGSDDAPNPEQVIAALESARRFLVGSYQSAAEHVDAPEA